ncbi:MAG: sulfotransferase [Novosphingobium sp.]
MTAALAETIRRGWDHAAAGDDARAEAHFRAALAADPAQPDALTGLAGVLRRRGMLRDAVLHCDAAIRAAPAHPEAWLERGFVLASGGSMAAARDCYARAAALDPTCAAAHAGLASILARDGDSEAGRSHAQRALALDPGNAVAAAALATMLIESGDAAAAAELLGPLAAALDAPSQDRALLLSLLGDARDRLGETDAAYACYGRSKADVAMLHEDRREGHQSHRDFISGIAERLEGLTFPPPAAVEQPPGAAANHVFLLGYPRSGTTLVENILASIPGVTALEERPTLADADLEFLAADDGLARFAQLSEDELAPWRAAYWKRAATAVAKPLGETFVDMDPLKGTRLPLIARLFPAAKIVLMRRDPRDVVWSCFHTHFALTNAALDFTGLERAARHYDAMMRLIELARARLPLTVHELDYHRLVADFDGETRALCAFAGLPWSEDLRRFGSTARTRGVSTASAGQVRRGLYDGRRQWERYAEQMAPVLPLLQPWVERFGYAGAGSSG